MKYKLKDGGIQLELLGQIGVDAGCCLIADPCYVLPASESLSKYKDKYPEVGFLDREAYPMYKDWDAFLDSLSGENSTHLKLDNGADMGVVVSTGYGDGTYPVYGYRDSNGRIFGVFVDFGGLVEAEGA